MIKNTASQVICAQLISKTDGSDVTTGTTTVYVLGDGGTQATTGTATHEGNGCWSYVPSQAETNFNHIAFTFKNSAAVSATVQVYTISYDPHNTTSLGLGNLDAAMSTRAPENGGNIATIVAKTNSLTFTTANRLDASVRDWAGSSVTSTNIARKDTLAKGSELTGFNDLSSAQVKSQVDDSLNTAIPVSPTTDSINERIKTLDDAYTTARATKIDFLTGDAFARLGVPVLASVSLDVAAVKADTAACKSDLETVLPDPTAGAPPATPTPRQALSYAYLDAVAKKVLNANTGKKEFYNKANVKIADANVTDASSIATVEALT